MPRRRRRLTGSVVAGSIAIATLPLFAPISASAVSTSATANGASWTINDARRPGLDTGSIRNVSNSRLEGFGNIFVHVEGTDTPRMNDQMLRGFGLTADAAGSYRSTKSVRLGDALISRKVKVDAATNTAAFFDTFTNTSTQPLSLDVSFGGSLGYGSASTTSGTINGSSDGNTTIDAGDSWATATSSSNNYRPTAVVVGSAAPFAGATTRIGDQQNDPFTVDYKTTGSAANDPGFINKLTIAPGTTKSLARFVAVGAANDTTAIKTTASTLAATPDFSNLTVDEICTLANWDLTTVPGFNVSACTGVDPLQLPAAPADEKASANVAYDVTGKTIAALQADLRAGRVTSVEITKAYLDRIDAYDGGQLGFNAFITVAKTAVAQAVRADQARKNGADSDLLGIPIAIKDLYDTTDMPTTGGTRALEKWQPQTDAWQVAKLRAAGAVIIGKTNLSEFANSGSWSESGFKQTWNALYPSKSSFGSSGGSAVAVGADLAAAAMGTQTGVSLYAPTTGASLTAFRGTDGLTSTEGVMPLTWGQDYAGPIAKTVTDLASLLNATATQTTGNDPGDLLTSRVDNSKRPTDWKAELSTTALQGKKIGYIPSSFTSSSVADDTTGAVAFAKAKASLEAAGATLVEMATTAPAAPTGFNVSGNAGAEGWERYIAAHGGSFPFATPKALLESKANLPYNVSSNYTSVGMDDANTETFLARRDAYKVNTNTWMDASGVDAVMYAGFISSVGNNDATSAVFSSDRGTGVLTSTIGLPTVILPIGTNDDGQSNSLQIVGRGWDDAKVLAMGYALEQQADAQITTAFAPALNYVADAPATSTTSVRVGSTSIAYGTATKATVTVSSDPTASGSISVKVDGKTVTGTLSGGSASVNLPKTIAVGTHLVTASFAGTSKVAASSATTTLRVTKGSPKLSVSLSKKKITTKQRAKVSVAIRFTGAATPTTVLVYDGSKIITSATVSRSGKRTISLPKLKKGTHRISVKVVPGSTYGSVTSSKKTLKVVKK